MYRHAYQRGMLTIFYSIGSKPLQNWETYTQNGYISRFLDHDIRSMVLEIGGTNVSTTYMICPKGKMVLGITMPFLVMVVKNLSKYFTFEVTVLDDTSTRRRFRVSNFQSTTQVLPLCTVMPIGLSEGWNQIQFNLAEFTRRAYKKQFVEVQKVKINANIRLRRIYFTEKILPEDQLPSEYKLFFPLKQNKLDKEKKSSAVALDKNMLSEKQKLVDAKKSTRRLSVVTTGSKPSMLSIKRPSQEQHEAERSSKILEVEEDELERIHASHAVVEGGMVIVSPEDINIIQKSVIAAEAEFVEPAESIGTTEIAETAEVTEVVEVTETVAITEAAEVPEVAEIAELANIADEKNEAVVSEDPLVTDGSVHGGKVYDAELDAGFEEDDEYTDEIADRLTELA